MAKVLDTTVGSIRVSSFGDDRIELQLLKGGDATTRAILTEAEASVLVTALYELVRCAGEERQERRDRHARQERLYAIRNKGGQA